MNNVELQLILLQKSTQRDIAEDFNLMFGQLVLFFTQCSMVPFLSRAQIFKNSKNRS